MEEKTKKYKNSKFREYKLPEIDIKERGDIEQLDWDVEFPNDDNYVFPNRLLERLIENSPSEYFLLDKNDQQFMENDESRRGEYEKSWKLITDNFPAKRIYLRYVPSYSQKNPNLVLVEDVWRAIPILLKQQNYSSEYFQEKIDLLRADYQKKSFNGMPISVLEQSTEVVDINKDLITLLPDPTYEISRWNALYSFEHPIHFYGAHGERLLTNRRIHLRIFQTLICGVNWSKNHCTEHPNCLSLSKRRTNIFKFLLNYEEFSEALLTTEETFKTEMQCMESSCDQIARSKRLDADYKLDSKRYDDKISWSSYLHTCSEYGLVPFDCFKETYKKGPPVWLARILYMTSWIQAFFPSEWKDQEIVGGIIEELRDKVPQDKIEEVNEKLWRDLTRTPEEQKQSTEDLFEAHGRIFKLQKEAMKRKLALKAKKDAKKRGNTVTKSPLEVSSEVRRDLTPPVSEEMEFGGDPWNDFSYKIPSYGHFDKDADVTQYVLHNNDHVFVTSFYDTSEEDREKFSIPYFIKFKDPNEMRNVIRSIPVMVNEEVVPYILTDEVLRYIPTVLHSFPPATERKLTKMLPQLRINWDTGNPSLHRAIPAEAFEEMMKGSTDFKRRTVIVRDIVYQQSSWQVFQATSDFPYTFTSDGQIIVSTRSALHHIFRTVVCNFHWNSKWCQDNKEIVDDFKNLYFEITEPYVQWGPCHFVAKEMLLCDVETLRSHRIYGEGFVVQESIVFTGNRIKYGKHEELCMKYGLDQFKKGDPEDSIASWFGASSLIAGWIRNWFEGHEEHQRLLVFELVEYWTPSYLFKVGLFKELLHWCLMGPSKESKLQELASVFSTSTEQNPVMPSKPFKNQKRADSAQNTSSVDKSTPKSPKKLNSNSKDNSLKIEIPDSLTKKESEPIKNGSEQKSQKISEQKPKSAKSPTEPSKKAENAVQKSLELSSPESPLRKTNNGNQKPQEHKHSEQKQTPSESKQCEKCRRNVEKRSEAQVAMEAAVKKADKYEEKALKAMDIEKAMKKMRKEMDELKLENEKMKDELEKSAEREEKLNETNLKQTEDIEKLKDELKIEKQRVIEEQQGKASLSQKIDAIQLKFVLKDSQREEETKKLMDTIRVLRNNQRSTPGPSNNSPFSSKDSGPSTSTTQKERLTIRGHLMKWWKFKDEFEQDLVLKGQKEMAEKLLSITEDEHTKRIAEYESKRMEKLCTIYLETIEFNILKLKNTDDAHELLDLPSYPTLSQNFIKKFQEEMKKQPEPNESGNCPLTNCYICFDPYVDGDKKDYCNQCKKPVHVNCNAKWRETLGTMTISEWTCGLCRQKMDDKEKGKKKSKK